MSAQSITTPTLNRDELEQAERRARHFWVSLIVGLLGLQVAGGITAIFLSVGDPSMAIVPNYHQAALNWDVTSRPSVDATARLENRSNHWSSQ